MADDLGYGELGAYGQTKIETPNLDELAKTGMLFRQYYSGSPVCAPSRCILLTGKHSGNAYIRGNDEAGDRGNVWDFYAMAKDPGLEGQRPMADSVVTVAEKLLQAGYATALFGKWGLGYPGSESTPNSQGFEYFYGYNCQRQAHTLTPLHLWRNEERDLLMNDTLPPRTKLDEGVDTLDEKSYDKYFQPDYAPTKIFDELSAFLKNKDDRPFCIFWESPIPHLPLQAPRKWIRHYVDKFGQEPPYTGDRGYFPARYPRATYAAMVTYLDHNIGLVIQQLKDQGDYDNTIIIFTSDNGPSYTGGTDSPWFDSGGPFRSEYGWGKGFLREGGIRVPFIASWPGRIKSSAESNHICSAQDLFPTFCEIAGIEYDEEEVDGISLLPTLLGSGQQKQHPYLYWEFPEYGGQRAVRKGDLKAFVRDIHKGNERIEVYNLATDIREESDIAEKHPQFVEEVKSIFEQEHVTSFNKRWQFARIDAVNNE